MFAERPFLATVWLILILVAAGGTLVGVIMAVGPWVTAALAATGAGGKIIDKILKARAEITAPPMPQVRAVTDAVRPASRRQRGSEPARS